MPLLPNMSPNEVRGELIHSWKKKGAIGKSRKIGFKKARKVATAIMYDQMRRGKTKGTM